MARANASGLPVESVLVLIDKMVPAGDNRRQLPAASCADKDWSASRVNVAAVVKAALADAAVPCGTLADKVYWPTSPIPP